MREPLLDTDGSIAHPKCVIYGNRSRHDPGLIHNGDLVVRAFESIGWGWGGNWNGPKDYQLERVGVRRCSDRRHVFALVDVRVSALGGIF